MCNISYCIRNKTIDPELDTTQKPFNCLVCQKRNFIFFKILVKTKPKQTGQLTKRRDKTVLTLSINTLSLKDASLRVAEKYSLANKSGVLLNSGHETASL